jgi:coenzyme F420-dependent glucose-6-phosphate dehydrogenase
MIRIGFHASHEQFPPSELLDLVQEAEAAGFDCAMSSDHFKPWGPARGHSGFAWSWLGAALKATAMPFGAISVPLSPHIGSINLKEPTLHLSFADQIEGPFDCPS